ncbi:GAK system ATP-grasp enzyme [bacterium]|nr:GAK system ATP-grasp enzyme [bacterium]
MIDAPLRIGVIGLPGKWSTEALADALEERTGHRIVIELAQVACDLAEGRVTFGDVNLCELDGLVIKKAGESYHPDMLDRLEILRYVESRGVPIFSKPLSIMRLLDRVSCTITLAAADIPMPPTIITENLDEASAAVDRFGAVVLKPLYSTKARGMTVVRADEAHRDEVLRYYKENGNGVLYIQKMIPLPGRDLGVVFLGGEYVGTYARVKTNEAWNTTTRSGGKYDRHDPSPRIIEVAQKAQALFDLSFTSVDVVEGENGPIVFEVSAFGGFRGLKEGLEVDASKLYADYVIDQVREAHGA